MRPIGMIGGMSWESTREYYRILNETMRTRRGGFHSAPLILYSVDFAEIEALQQQAKWQEIARLLVDAARRVEAAGSCCVLLCTNTMHKLADDIQAHLGVPLLHIADATGQKIQAQGLATVGLLGTRVTMEEDFYVGRLSQNYGLKVLVPSEEERELVHRVIYHELCMGEIRPSSRAHYTTIIERLVEHGAEGIVLGCTEIGLLVRPEDSPVPLFDTTEIHAVAAVDYILDNASFIPEPGDA
ncbi:MAG: aspartate/glutamate racemase family protein [Chloroflexaceae bacterium]|nr:aspartate/glutamate racemase family protein [Chloroflexaceae bacterium]